MTTTATVPSVLAGLTQGGFSVEDNDSHKPGDEANWQESSLFCFFDSRTEVAGYHRIGIHPNTGTTQVYSWTTVGGRTVDRRMFVELPLPDGQIADTEIGGVGISTVTPLHEWQLTITGAATTRALWTSYTGPLTYSLDSGGAKLAQGHYNSLGRARGQVQVDGRTVEFDAVGYMDHSWGPRDGNSVLSHQWMLAIFDEDFYVTAMPVALPQANVMFGYACDRGELAHLTDIDTNFTVGFDNHQPRSGAATLLDAAGRNYRISGVGYGDASLQPFGHGHFVTHRAARFTCGDRTGHGLLEMSGPRTIPPKNFAELNLDPNQPWVTGPRREATADA